MKVETYRDLVDGADFDFVVVGSGFGGSVSALRLAEKGYRVAVLEAGRHFEDRDFARSNWQLHRYLWLPKLFLYGLQRLTLLRDVLILGGAGVGGGSLVYANTLLEPGEGFFGSPECRRLAPDLKERLKPHYATAKRMLGVAANPRLFAADLALKAVAEGMGRGSTFHSANVGVFFGVPGRTVPDPYFGGAGPERAGCVFCGGCMVGCRHNAKNTLAKNYLPLAVKRGARIFSLTTVARIDEADGGFTLSVRRSGWGWGTKRLRARSLVVSAGVLGTLRLLLNPENRLSRLPPRLGRDVRTNSEVLVGSTARAGGIDYSEGLAITSGMWPDDKTHVEVVRYSAGSDAMNLLAVRGAPGGSIPSRLARLGLSALRRPADALRTLIPLGWAQRTTILLFMQTADSRLRLGLRRLAGLISVLSSSPEPGETPPMTLPAAESVLESFAARTDGIPQSSIGTFLNVSTTAHILGGAAMGTSPEDGVVDLRARVFGYDNLWIVDGSIIPANLGVNPSLTITALAEHAMEGVPAAGPERSPA